LGRRLGIEAQLGGNWSVKKEYLFLDLGTVSNAFNTVSPRALRAWRQPG